MMGIYNEFWTKLISKTNWQWLAAFLIDAQAEVSKKKCFFFILKRWAPRGGNTEVQILPPK